MKNPFIGLILLAILFTIAFSAPVEKGDSVLHHPFSHRGLSHRIRAALTKRSLNLTFTPTDTINDFVHVEHGTLPQPQMSYPGFSATLLKLGRDDEIDTQVVIRSPDIYGGRHVIISIPDTLVQALQQKGVLQDNIPQYVRQNVHAVDPTTGNRYQLVPDSHLEKPVSIDPNAIMITLELN